MRRIKRLEEKFNELEKKYDALEKTTWAYKWLIDHPSGVSYNTTTDFTTFGMYINHILNIDYFDNRYGKVVSFKPIISYVELDVKTVAYDRLTGLLEIIFVKVQNNNRTYYEYKKNVYQDGSSAQLRIDWNGTGEWKNLPMHSSDLSCIIIS